MKQNQNKKPAASPASRRARLNAQSAFGGKLLPIITICIMALIAGSLVVNAVVIENPLKYDDIGKIIGAIGGLLKVLAIGIGTIMIIIAGIQYMTSAGNEERAAKAKKTILYTLIGVAIVVAVDFIIGLIGEIVGKK